MLAKETIATGAVNGFISFAVAQLVVAEDTGLEFTAVSVPFTRSGGTTSNVAVTFQVKRTSQVYIAILVN